MISGFLTLIIASLPTQAVDIPANWSYPAGSANTGEPGFMGNARQARSDTNLSATIARGNSHLMDQEIDPGFDSAYENTLVDTSNPDVGTEFWESEGRLAINPDGSFILPTALNFSGSSSGFVTDPEVGSFTSANGFPDTFFPGFPGETLKGNLDYNNGLNYSVEFLGFIHLPAGTTTLTLRNDDASQLAIHPNDARDIFRTGLIESNSNNAAEDRSVTLNVAEEGLYSIRVLLAQWMTESQLEFFSGEDNTKALVNAPASGSAETPTIDISSANGEVTVSWTPAAGILEESPDLAQDFEPTIDQTNPQTFTPEDSNFYRVSAGGSPEGLRVWRSITSSTRPYISAVAPASGESGVAVDSNITVTLQNLGAGTPVMRVNNSPVSFTTNTVGSESTLTYDPPSDFSNGETVSVELDYGNATASWEFIITTGDTAIVISGSAGDDTALKTRLAEDFGLDVIQFTTAADPADVAAAAATAKLVYHSSSVSSVAALDIALALRDLPVPIACAESGNSDEYFLAGSSGNVPGTQPNVQMVILDSGHPTAGGLAAGTYPLVTSFEVALFANPYPEMVRVAEAPEYDGNMRPTLTAVESGVSVDGGSFFHRNRRVFCGAFGNDGASKLTTDGETVFNATITWLLDGVPSEP